MSWKHLPIANRKESSRLSSEGDKSSTLSHITDESWQKPAAWAPTHCS